jgi:hypothetical protein
VSANGRDSTAHDAQLGVISRAAVSGNSIPITSMVTRSMGSAKRNIAYAGRFDVSACDSIDTGID